MTIEQSYQDILDYPVKYLPEKQLTFLDLAGLSTSELPVSNLYAYYFNPIASHGLGDLFLTSLCEIIHRKTGKTVIKYTGSALVKREVYTRLGNSIDLIIIEPDENGTGYENAIIIENKINATIKNDLSDYFNHIEVSGNKIGVLLTIRKESPAHPQYININHQELIENIEQYLGLNFTRLETRQLFLLKEFIQHLKSFSMSQDLSEQYAFYFKFEEKIRSILKLEQAIKTDLFNQLAITCDQLDLQLGAPYHSSLRYFHSKKSPVYYTIWMAGLFTPAHQILIIVELNRQGIQELDKINKIQFSDEEKAIIKETTPVRTTYLHYAVESLIVDSNNIRSLSDIVFKKITTTNLQPIFLKIEACLCAPS